MIVYINMAILTLINFLKLKSLQKWKIIKQEFVLSLCAENFDDQNIIKEMKK